MRRPAKRTAPVAMSSDEPAFAGSGVGRSLERVGRAIATAIGKPLEFLGMDACLMADLEVAEQLHHVVRHMVASPALVPGHTGRIQRSTET